MSNAGRRPDYRVAIMDKNTDEKNHSAGGAWTNDDGSISVRLEGFLQITTTKGFLMTLFPTKEKSA